MSNRARQFVRNTQAMKARVGQLSNPKKGGHSPAEATRAGKSQPATTKEPKNATLMRKGVRRFIEQYGGPTDADPDAERILAGLVSAFTENLARNALIVMENSESTRPTENQARSIVQASLAIDAWPTVSDRISTHVNAWRTHKDSKKRDDPQIPANPDS